jgi:uncharacterized protein YqhQ
MLATNQQNQPRFGLTGALTMNELSRQQQTHTQLQAAGAIINFLSSENIVNHMGWIVYIPTTIVITMFALNQHFNKEERNENFVWLLISSIILLAISIAYIYTFYKNKDVNKWFNYMAIMPIIGMIIAFFVSVITSTN